MTQRQGVEAALAAWRDAERRLDAHIGDPEEVMAEIEADQAEFQRLCKQDVIDPISETAAG
jgi:alkanesulfonate monooxygenase SsuD/methylene tetrahydromethanopterin reductase-like flavin-dependent oxidoreductase (luciferase family)